MTASSSCAGISTAKRVADPGARFARRTVATHADAVRKVRYPTGTASARRNAPRAAAAMERGRRARRRPGTGPPSIGADRSRTVATVEARWRTAEWPPSPPAPGCGSRYLAAMHRGDGDDFVSRRPVLFLNTPTAPPLGADTWIHIELMRRLDRTAWAPIAAHAFGSEDEPTPTHRAVREIPDLELVRADLGPDRSERTPLATVKDLLATVPAISTIARLAVLIRRRRVRIIHTSDRPRDAFVAVLLGRMTGAVSIVHVHVAYNPSWMGWMLRWSLAHADALVAVSEFVGRTIVDGGIETRRVHVVKNGVDIARWHPDIDGAPARVRLGISQDAPLLLTICRLFPEKGPGEAIDAVGRLRAEFPAIQLLI